MQGKVNDFLSKTSFNDNWRIVIIDSADEMNKNAANALLKILEEPPAHTILLLISHNAGLLLPTIRSRCAKLPLQMLNTDETASLLRRYRSNLNEAMIAKIAEMCPQSIGKAIGYADLDAVEMYDNFNTDSFDQMDQKRSEIRFIEQSSLAEKACRSCPYFLLCRSGCRRNRGNGMQTEPTRNNFCEGYKIFFERWYDTLMQLGKLVQR